jgi:DNA-binding transcriptional MerR regulator
MGEIRLSIGDVAARSGTKTQTVRWYEQVGILPKAARTSGNQRTYAHADLERLVFVRSGRELGFSLDQIRRLLTLSDDADMSCGEVDVIAQEHLAEVREKIAQLRALEGELERIIGACRQGTVSDCRIIQTLNGKSA